MPFGVRRCHQFGLKNAYVMAKWHFRLPNFLASDIFLTAFLFSGGRIFRQFKYML
jgi:hypothetical protein